MGHAKWFVNFDTILMFMIIVLNEKTLDENWRKKIKALGAGGMPSPLNKFFHVICV